MIVRFHWPTPEAAESAHDHVRYPWIDSSVRLAVRHLAPDQEAEYVRLVPRRIPVVRERAHTVLEADAGDPAAIADAWSARGRTGPGGGRKCGPI